MKMYIADFETTVEEIPSLQEYTEVWAFGIAQLFDRTEKVVVGNSISLFWKYLQSLKDDFIVVYFHNLKFDGTFILYDLIENQKFSPAFVRDMDKCTNYKTAGKFKERKELAPGEFTTVITDNGIWYSILVRFENITIEFRDSLKLLPMSISEMGPAFNTKHRKLEMDYKAHKGAGEVIDEFEKAYICNDILVPKEALEFFLTEMNYKEKPPLTISQAALKEFKKLFTKSDWDLYFPNLAEFKIDPEIFGSENADEYCRRAYGGGWCYADERVTGLINGHTRVYDVNSLYSSVMHSESGNYYPIGKPIFITEMEGLKKVHKNTFFIMRFRCKFKLKPGYLPFIQIKYDADYRTNENLKESGKDRYNTRIPEKIVEMTLTRPMFTIFNRAYEITDFEFLDAALFETELGMFDRYINRFKSMKERATIEKNSGRRTIAKLFLNGLYGKFGTDPENTFYIPQSDNQGNVDYKSASGENKKPVYVPIAAAVTSYARRFTVSAACYNYKYFVYSDTDSIHLAFPKDWTQEQIDSFEPVGIQLHDTKLLCWKVECDNTNSIYLRQKTYMDFSPDKEYKDARGQVQKGIYDIKACGLPERGKLIYEASIKELPCKGSLLEIPHTKKIERVHLEKEDMLFLHKHKGIKDFAPGLSIPGKLMHKKIKGGCVLIETNFTII